MTPIEYAMIIMFGTIGIVGLTGALIVIVATLYGIIKGD